MHTAQNDALVMYKAIDTEHHKVQENLQLIQVDFINRYMYKIFHYKQLIWISQITPPPEKKEKKYLAASNMSSTAVPRAKSSTLIVLWDTLINLSSCSCHRRFLRFVLILFIVEKTRSASALPTTMHRQILCKSSISETNTDLGSVLILFCL